CVYVYVCVSLYDRAQKRYFRLLSLLKPVSALYNFLATSVHYYREQRNVTEIVLILRASYYELTGPGHVALIAALAGGSFQHVCSH
ncbi:hypothetical protein, partial [Thiolapillus sp.]|uniref:hypothetical protein n=1 Tax=Thiolapillus sp. TaxID=2017437 RepID=UPI003AF8415B